MNKRKASWLSSPEITRSPSRPSLHPSHSVLPLARVGSFPPQAFAICEGWLGPSCEGQPWRDMWAPDCHPWGCEAGLIDFKPGCMTCIRTQWLERTKDKFTEGCGHTLELPPVWWQTDWISEESYVVATRWKKKKFYCKCWIITQLEQPVGS